jgi:hypothetical protein
MARDFAFSLMSGVALGDLLGTAYRPAQEYLDALKFLYHLLEGPQ